MNLFSLSGSFKSKLVFTFLLVCVTCASIKDESPIVQISDGKIKGTFRTNFDGDNFWAFLSIPYAKPPLEQLRFKAPEPAEPWEGVLDTTKQGNVCTQYSKGPYGSEDCLYLNVFTKKLPTEDKNLKPVMVYIHGGGFVTGSSTTDMFGPDFLLTEDIILVTINYRLGLFGFLSLEDPSLDVPGNAGLKDQVLALRWIKENIKNFNGDPNKVTIFGESAGAVSVEYLLLSSLAKNLFQGAITESGSTLVPWARSRLNITDFATYIKSDLKMSKLLDVLRNMSAADLIIAQNNYGELYPRIKNGGLYAPVIEKPNPTAIITEHPIDVIKSGNYNAVPVIIGYNSKEGLVLEYYNRINKKPIQDDFPWPASMFLPYDTDLNDPDQVKGMSDIITEFYTREEYRNDTYMLPTDGLFVSSIITSVLNQVKVSQNPVYLYRFSVDAGLNLLKTIAGMQNFTGACHGDELGYLFTGILPLPTGEVEISTVRRMVKLWTNFAKYGNPTPEGTELNINWKPVEIENIYYLDIGEDLVTSSNPEPERLECWREVYKLNNITATFL